MQNIIQATLTDYEQSKQIIKRAAILAAIIGSSLTFLNQTDAIFGDAELQILPMTLVFLTPFLVVGLSQAFGIREANRVLSQNLMKQDRFARTLLSHGIPLRAVTLGLAAGIANTIIVTITNSAAGQSLDQLPVALILQALSLPIIFGALSQALSFRRTVRQSA